MTEKIADVIKYEGDNTTFIWKHPLEDFNTGAQLIVHESQEAVLFMNGQALDLFGPGQYTLETQSIPIVSKFFNRATGDVTPFHCEVYFINKTEQMEIKWGTDSRVEYVEPAYGFPLQIGASGEMSLYVEDSRKLLVKLVGTETTLSRQALVSKFRMFLNARIKTYLVQLIKAEKINIFEIDEHMTRMSEALHKQLQPDFMDYGVALARFFVGTFVKPEEDRAYQKFKELHFRQYADVAEAKLRQQVGVIEQETQARRMVIEAEGIAQKRAVEGYTYQDERGFDVAERVASNQAVGQLTNIGVGLGMITGVGGAVGNTVGGMAQQAIGGVLHPGSGETASETLCPACGKKTPAGKFCVECGAALAQKCPGCGADVPTGVKFCGGCGHKFAQEERQS